MQRNMYIHLSLASTKLMCHYTTYLYTSQQNGITPYKNRHLFDVAHKMIFHVYAPKFYWRDTILTVLT